VLRVHHTGFADFGRDEQRAYRLQRFKFTEQRGGGVDHLGQHAAAGLPVVAGVVHVAGGTA